MANFKEGYALIIGVSNYPNISPLPRTVLKDAIDLYEVLCSPDNCGYFKSNARLLLDSKATRNNILSGLSWLITNTPSDATILLFFSGHGGRLINDSSMQNCLLPYDCDPSNLSKTAILDKELTQYLYKIRAERLLVFFDCCYSGGLGVPKGTRFENSISFKSGIEEGYYDKLATGKGRVIMASSRSDELSLVLPGMCNSLFTHYLLKVLRGEANVPLNDSAIRVFDIFDYVSNKVSSQAQQHPIFKASNLENNFPVALHMGGKASEIHLSTLSHSIKVNRRALRDILIKNFSILDLKYLCTDIEQDLANNGIDIQLNLEMVGGGNKIEYVLNLIDYLERREYTFYLVKAIHNERPFIDF